MLLIYVTMQYVEKYVKYFQLYYNQIYFNHIEQIIT